MRPCRSSRENSSVSGTGISIVGSSGTSNRSHRDLIRSGTSTTISGSGIGTTISSSGSSSTSHGAPEHRFQKTQIASIIVAAAILLSCSDGLHDVSTERITLRIGSSTVDLVQHRSDARGLTYLNLHDDENTAVEAALALIRTHGGVVYELQHGGERNLTFRLNATEHTADPNRIFTDTGIHTTLGRHGSSSAEARAAVRSLSDSLLYHVGFDELPVVVTIHNNTENGYSSLSYDEGGNLAADARAVHLGPDVDPDDFYFVTSERLFDALRAQDTNVVLQDNSTVQDDGSLSVRAGREHIPYVNVEAQHGHIDAQRSMLERLHDVLAAE